MYSILLYLVKAQQFRIFIQFPLSFYNINCGRSIVTINKTKTREALCYEHSRLWTLYVFNDYSFPKATGLDVLKLEVTHCIHLNRYFPQPESSECVEVVFKMLRIVILQYYFHYCHNITLLKYVYQMASTQCLD